MLLPENPITRPVLWSALASQLTQTAICFIINDGVGNPLVEAKVPSRNEAEVVLARLRQAQICRISANRGIAISPHFAGKREGEAIFVTELLTSPPNGVLTVDKEQLKRELETVAINLLFTEEGVNTVVMPMAVPPWEMQDAKICLVKEGLIFTKQG